MQSDARGFRIAVVPDELVNDRRSEFDVLELLTQTGWGAIILPPSWYPPELGAKLLTQLAENVAEFVHHGYDIVCVGSCGGLAAPLKELGIAMPDTVKATGWDELSRSLLRRPDPTPTGTQPQSAGGGFVRDQPL